MSFKQIINNLTGDICVNVDPQFEGDIVIYTFVYALSKMIKGNVTVDWPGHIPPAADRLFPVNIQSLGNKCIITITPSKVSVGDKSFTYKYSPAELLINGVDVKEDILAALFVSLYASTKGFAVDDLSDDIFDWFERLLQRGFPHYKYVDIIYVISSPEVFHVWGEVLKSAREKDGVVYSIYEGNPSLLPPEWFKVASYLGRYTGKGRVYVKREDGYEYFDNSGERGLVKSI